MTVSLRLLLDENIEHEVLHRLESLGHDVEHVDLSREVGKGDTDPELARYSLEASRIIVTYDDDFVTDVGTSKYHCVLLIEDKDMSSRSVSRAIHAMSEVYPADEFQGLQKVGREWL